MWVGYLFFAAGDGWAASFSVDADKGVVTVSMGFGGDQKAWRENRGSMA